MTATEKLLLAIGMSIGLQSRMGDQTHSREVLDMIAKLLVKTYIEIGGDANVLHQYGIKTDD